MIEFSEKQRKALAVAQQRGAIPYARLAKLAGVDRETLRRWRKVEAFDRALQAAIGGTLQAEDAAVSIETFVTSPDYLNLDGKVWPVVLGELKQINSGHYDLILLAGSLGSAKTYTACISIVYSLYRLLLLDDPHRQYGLDSHSPIIVGVQNRTRKLAERNDYALCRNLITASPWFQQFAPWDDRLKSRVKFTGKNVELWPASGDAEDLLGMNLFSLLLDEGNFFAKVEKSKRSIDGRQFDQAREAFEGALRRKQSRFPDSAGLFLVASSKRFKGQFTDELTAEFADDPRTYVYNHNQWTIRPELYADGGWFNAFVGDRQRPARILGDDEAVHPVDRSLVIAVPQRFRRRFKADIVRSLQDIAGISTEISGAFFADKVKVAVAASLDQRIIATADAVGDARKLLLTKTPFIDCPDSPRIVHGDLSLSGDLTGIGCGYIKRYTDLGFPEIAVDCVARVHPPRGGQIELDSIFWLIAGWQRQGIPIRWVSFDGYQSADLLQRVRRLGLHAGKLSVDMTTPGDPMAAYECLRQAISEGRFTFPDDAETVEDLLWLQADYEKRRVDHLPQRKKDTADCLAAIAYHLTHQVQAFTLADKVEGAGFAAAVASPNLGAQITNIPPHQGFESAMSLVRWQRGIGGGYVD